MYDGQDEYKLDTYLPLELWQHMNHYYLGIHLKWIISSLTLNMHFKISLGVDINGIITLRSTALYNFVGIETE